MSVRKQFIESLHTCMAKDSNIILILGDLGYGHFDKIRIDFPDRVYNPGAAELLMVGMATGMALEGKIPICYSITPFVIFRPFEILRNYLDHEEIPVKLVGAGRDKDYGALGFSHWGVDDKVHMNSFKNIVKSWPKNSKEMESQFNDLIYNNKPTYINLSR